MPTTVYPAREGQKFAADTELVVVSCSTCHITYAIPESLHRSALKYRGDTPNGWKLCCPLGHTWWYVGETEQQQRQRGLERQLECANERAGRLAAERDQERQDAIVQKRRATRFKNDRDRERRRVAAGVCPCCSRTFQNLARHMAAKHPDHAHSER